MINAEPWGSSEHAVSGGKQQVQQQEVGSFGWAVCKEQAMCLEAQGRGTITGLMGPDYRSSILNEMESH